MGDVRLPSPAVNDELVWLCSTAVEMAGVTCCGVTMVTGSGQSVTAHASDKRAAAIEDVQHTLGEGPGVAASDSGAAVLVPDLGDLTDRTLALWPLFAAESVAMGIRAAFAFPLLLGTSSVGAFTLYRTESGVLGPEALTLGWVTADAVGLALADPVEHLMDMAGPKDPMRVHQAAGMVMVQLGVPIDQALSRMRATAFAEGNTVDQLADEIVQRRQRMSKERS